MSTRKTFNFEEFYRAFSKSVPGDVTFENGEIQVVQRAELSSSHSITTKPTGDSNALSKPTDSHIEGSDINTQSPVVYDLPLPAHLAALADLQEPDGSWKFSKEFEFVINGVASPPPEGISGKLWATSVCINVYRQSPEWFAQLEVSYDRAMLHCDEDFLRRIKAHIDFDNLESIRKYSNDEARAIRDLLAREAAAKRALEEEEDRKFAREREEIEQITDFSMEKARRLPLKTQSHFVKGLRSEVRDIFRHSHSTVSGIGNLSFFQADEVVECCWRRRSRTERAAKQDTWHPCTITAFNGESKSVHIQFLDSDQERERKVALCYIRRRPEEERAIRDAEFERLRATWKEPIVCADEVTRLEEIQAKKKRPKPWSSSNSQPILSKHGEASLPSISSSLTHTSKDPKHQQQTRNQQQTRELTFSARNRAMSIMRARSASTPPDLQQDGLYQTAFNALLVYDRAYMLVKDTVKSCARKYTTAILYKERFHAFDDFREALVILMKTTTDALEQIAQWKTYSKSIKANKGESPIFVWNGQNFVLMLSRSLDFLVCHRELIEWYGDEFPLEFNPFMLSKSLVDKAKDMGLRLATNSVGMLRLHKKAPDDEASFTPTWWPETQYDDELLARIAKAETHSCGWSVCDPGDVGNGTPRAQTSKD